MQKWPKIGGGFYLWEFIYANPVGFFYENGRCSVETILAIGSSVQFSFFVFNIFFLRIIPFLDNRVRFSILIKKQANSVHI